MGKISGSWTPPPKLENKMHVLSNKTDNVQNIYNYSQYEYLEQTVEIIDRTNDIMYEHVYDNYINILTEIAKIFDKEFIFSSIDIGLILVNKVNVQIYMYFKNARFKLLTYSNDYKQINSNKKLMDILDELNNKGLGLYASINNRIPSNIYISSYDNWEIVKEEYGGQTMSNNKHIIKISLEEAYSSIMDFYDTIAKKLGITPDDKIRYDCKHINISTDIQNKIFEFYKNEKNVENSEAAMYWLAYGPKAFEEMDELTVEVTDEFIVKEVA